MSLYYFIASLPLLQWGESPAIEPDQFMDACGDQMSAALAPVAKALASGAIPPGESPGFLPAWRNADNQIRNAIASQRAARRHVDASRNQRPTGHFDLAIETGVKESFAHRTPLEREQALDRIRWNKVGELCGFDPFSISTVLAYAVRLNIAQRWATLDTEAGREAARQLIEQKVEDSHQESGVSGSSGVPK